MPEETYREFVLVNVKRTNDLEDQVTELNDVLRNTYFTDEPDVALLNVGQALIDVRDIRKTLDTIERELIGNYKANV